MFNRGKLIIFSAPSGSGKTTIVKHLLAQGLKLEFSISACNRPPRGEEKHGKDYYFLTTEEFKAKIETGAFAEWEEVYPGRYYGTLWTELHRIWDNGNQVLFDIDVKGGVALKKKFTKRALSIFVMPPSVDELRNRLINRNTDSIEEIEKRVAKAEEEITFAPQFDVVIVNDKLDEACQKAVETVRKFLK